MNKKDFWNLFFLTLLVFGVVIFCVYPDNMFGSVTDWGTQHTMLPEYFRTLFYHTGDLFPDFMMHLGAGQNIYNISYYGLLNPIVLISYLFPFIKMVDFMTIANIIIVLLSGYLFYYWLRKKDFSRTIVMISSIIFICAGPLIFHSHRHIMFMTYMPFLILGLIGVDRYFDKGKRILLTLSVLGMILTSYYYSIGGILVLGIYGIYYYLKREKKIQIKKFLVDGISFLWPILLGIGLSAILLLPTAYVIVNGRSGGKEPIALASLLTPHFDVGALVYGSYSIGLSAIAIYALFHTFFTRKKENIWLGIILTVVLSIPMIMYVLNGFLYVRSKVLIPFLPIFVFLIACLFQDLEKKRFSLKFEIGLIFLLAVFWYFTGYERILFYFDLVFCAFIFMLYQRWNKKVIYMVPVILISLGVVFSSNYSEKWQKRDDYQKSFHEDKIALIKDTLKKDQGFYRMNDLVDPAMTVNKVYGNRYFTTSLYSSTFHQPYKDFFYNEAGNADASRNRLVTSSSNNIFFQTLMGIKYVVTKLGEEPVGYQLVQKQGEYGLYQNNEVYPIGYVTDQLYDEAYYNKLSFPYNMELLMHGAITSGKGSQAFTSNIKEVNLSFTKDIKGLDIKKTKKGYTLKTEKPISFTLPLKEKLNKNQILILTFRINKSQKCKDGDLTLAINGISNKLTCKQWMYHNGNFDFEYVLSSEKDLEELSIYMSAGTFEIVNIKSYILDYTTFDKNKSSVASFEVDTKKTKGDTIIGSVNAKKTGYFVLTVPYDSSFSIKVDGKKQSYEKVNSTFIGFPISAGKHNIEIVYEAPFKKVGATISLISLCLFGFMLYQDIKKKEK